jgi:phosphopantetheinyl transferase (holo-ACP synthase)
MIVIGNDIVSLHDKRNQKSFKKTNRFFAYDTIITPNLISLITKHALFWAAKESAYKCNLKLGLKKAFSPALFQVHIKEIQNHVFSGWVSYRNIKLYVNLTINLNYINGIATNNPNIFSQINSFEIKAPKEVAEQVFLKKIQDTYQLNFPLFLQKDAHNIPYITHQEKLPLDISISHEENQFFFSSIFLSALC